jgi:hypothetical protein
MACCCCCCRAVSDDGLRQVLQHPTIKHSLTKLDVSGCKAITAAGLIIPPLVRPRSPFHRMVLSCCRMIQKG